MNRINVSLQQSIITLVERGWSKRRIARELQLDRRRRLDQSARRKARADGHECIERNRLDWFRDRRRDLVRG